MTDVTVTSEPEETAAIVVPKFSPWLMFAAVVIMGVALALLWKSQKRIASGIEERIGRATGRAYVDPDTPSFERANGSKSRSCSPDCANGHTGTVGCVEFQQETSL